MDPVSTETFWRNRALRAEKLLDNANKDIIYLERELGIANEESAELYRVIQNLKMQLMNKDKQ